MVRLAALSTLSWFFDTMVHFIERCGRDVILHLSDCRRPSCRRFRQTAKGDKFSYSAVHLAPASLAQHIWAHPTSQHAPRNSPSLELSMLKSQMHFLPWCQSGWPCSFVNLSLVLGFLTFPRDRSISVGPKHATRPLHRWTETLPWLPSPPATLRR